MNHRYASEREATAAANVCDLSNNMNGLRFPCFVKSGNAEISALHHYVPDLHRRMLLATLWNTYICINQTPGIDPD
jgi:hypothetical protein